MDMTLQGRHPGAIHRLGNPILCGGGKSAGQRGQEAVNRHLA
jgi:hypothetical protein